MEEYEHSFKVTSIEPFIEFCKKNGYRHVSVSSQNRKVYESDYNPHLISRLTTERVRNKTNVYFDFKLSENEIEGKKISQESQTLIVTEELMLFVKSALNILSFRLVADNFRTRYVYEKGGLTFEIDDYTLPEMKVIAVEGSKEAVENLCNNELKEILQKFAIKNI